MRMEAAKKQSALSKARAGGRERERKQRKQDGKDGTSKEKGQKQSKALEKGKASKNITSQPGDGKALTRSRRRP